MRLNTVRARLNTVRVRLNTVRARLNTVRVRLNTVRVRLNTVRVLLNTVRVRINTVRVRVNTVRVRVNTVRVRVNTVRVRSCCHTFCPVFLVSTLLYRAGDVEKKKLIQPTLWLPAERPTPAATAMDTTGQTTTTTRVSLESLPASRLSSGHRWTCNRRWSRNSVPQKAH